MSFIYSFLGFVILLGVLVFVHEWGHYAVARLFNVKVLRFSIGFGPVVWRRQWGETEWALSAIPLGGYVKMLDEREGAVPEEERLRAFNRQPPWKRIAIVAAGPLINLLFAWLVFALVFLIGYDTVRPVLKAPDQTGSWWIVYQVDQTPVYAWGDLQSAIMQRRLENREQVLLSGLLWPLQQEYAHAVSLKSLSVDGDVMQWLAQQGVAPKMPPLEPIVGRVMSDSPADRAGLRPGDRIVSIEGRPVALWDELVDWVKRHPGQQVTLVIDRDGRRVALSMYIGQRQDGTGFLGVGVDVHQALPEAFKAHVHFGLGEALARGWEKGWQFLFMTLEMLKRMLVGEAGLHNLSGPVSIAQFSGQALAQGWVSFLMLMGLISLSLGLLNLLPIPLLDGGHILFDLYEWLMGRPLPETVQVVAQKIGLAALFFLMLLALSNDMMRLFNG